MANTVINVNVTPVGVNGTDVDCDFAGAAEVVSNALFLKHTDDFDITFHLIQAHGVNTFAAQKPFCNQPNRCPRPGAGNAVPPFRLTAKSRKLDHGPCRPGREQRGFSLPFEFQQ